MISGGRKIKIFENFEFAQVIAKLGVYRTELDVSKLGMKVIFHSALFIISLIKTVVVKYVSFLSNTQRIEADSVIHNVYDAALSQI